MEKKKRNADIVQLVNFIINELEVGHLLIKQEMWDEDLGLLISSVSVSSFIDNY